MNKKKEDLVECKQCAHRATEWRNINICTFCNNTLKVVNPNNILCNLCDKCMCPIGTDNEQIPHGLYEAKITGGYFSTHLLDMNTYIFSFCEECLRNIFNQCKIKPKVYETSFRGNYVDEIPYVDDQESFEYNIWIDNGGFHQAYMNGLCNTKKDCNNKAVYTYLTRNEFTEKCACEAHGKILHNKNITKIVPFISHKLRVFL